MLLIDRGEVKHIFVDNKERLPRWNWAAFSLNVIWGIAHKCYWTLLCCIPIFGLFWMFVCGFKGNAWAWENGSYDSVEDFEGFMKGGHAKMLVPGEPEVLKVFEKE